MNHIFLLVVWLLAAATAQAQLAVTVSPVKVAGQKAVVPLALKNNFAGKIESARAVVFLLDAQGRAIGPPTTRWVIGGSRHKRGLAAGGTNTFNFVVTTARSVEATNLTAKVSFIRVVLAGRKLANVTRDVHIQKAGK
jgi:plasmid replication initiation protein